MKTQSLTPFQFRNHPLRVVADEHGNPWFCAKDACDILGYGNSRDAIARLCAPGGVGKRDVKSGGDVAKPDPSSRARDSQVMTFINEGNLYRLIIKSNKPQAASFEVYVCDEVLPSIRKNGGYLTPAAQAEITSLRDRVSDLEGQIVLLQHPRWGQVRRYRLAGLNNAETAKLMDLHVTTVRDDVRNLVIAGLLPPDAKQPSPSERRQAGGAP